MKKILVLLLLIALVGCQQDDLANQELEANETLSTEVEETEIKDEVNTTTEETEVDEVNTEEIIEEVHLIEKGDDLEAFIPTGWMLLDSITLDFNEDGLEDVVGVLAMENEKGTPRVLFGLENKSDHYKLSFENKNIVRTSIGGGPYGDPYLPLTTDGRSFTLNEKGGGAWRWDQLQTFEYTDQWHLIKYEHIVYNYDLEVLIVYKRIVDYKNGTATFDYNSRSFEDIKERNGQSEPYDLSFELKTGEAPTLIDYSAGTYLTIGSLEYLEIEMISADYQIEDEILSDLHKHIENMDTEFALGKKIIDDVEHLILYNRKTHNILVLDSKENPTDKSYGEMRRFGDSVYYIKFETDGHAVLYRTDLNGDIKEILGEWTADDFKFFHVGFQFYDDQILIYTTIDNMNYYETMNLDGSEKKKLGEVKGRDYYSN